MNYSQHDRDILNSIIAEIQIINSNMKQVTCILDSDIEMVYKMVKIRPFLYTCNLAYRRIDKTLETLPEYKRFMINTESVESWYAPNILFYEYKLGFEQVYNRLINAINDFFASKTGC